MWNTKALWTFCGSMFFGKRICKHSWCIYQQLVWLQVLAHNFFYTSNACKIRYAKCTAYWTRDYIYLTRYSNNTIYSTVIYQLYVQWQETLIIAHDYQPGIILCMHPANERQRYNVTLSLIGWVHSQYDPWLLLQQELPERIWYFQNGHFACVCVVVSNLTTLIL